MPWQICFSLHIETATPPCLADNLLFMNLFICVYILIHCSLYCFFLIQFYYTYGRKPLFNFSLYSLCMDNEGICLIVRHSPGSALRIKQIQTPGIYVETSVSATLTVCGPGRCSSTCSMHAGVAPAEAAFAVCTDLSHTLSSYPPLSSACQCLHQAYHKFQPTSHWGPPSLTPHHHHRGASPHPGLPAHFPPLSSSNPTLSRRDWGKDTQVASHP